MTERVFLNVKRNPFSVGMYSHRFNIEAEPGHYPPFPPIASEMPAFSHPGCPVMDRVIDNHSDIPNVSDPQPFT